MRGCHADGDSWSLQCLALRNGLTCGIGLGFCNQALGLTGGQVNRDAPGTHVIRCGRNRVHGGVDWQAAGEEVASRIWFVTLAAAG